MPKLGYGSGIFLLMLLLPSLAYALPPLQCASGAPVSGTTLYDDSNTGACQFVGIQYVFSTIVCQFVSMVNVIMGKLYCSIQAAATPVLKAVVTLYIVLYGAQMLMGLVQMNAGEVITRLLKLSAVVWLTIDPTFGVSAGISYMFNFFIAFISDTTRWVIEILDLAAGVNLYGSTMYNGTYVYNPGVTSVFFFLDNWIYQTLTTGTVIANNQKVFGFFMAVAIVVPTLGGLALLWFFSVVNMLVNTLITFLMAVVAIAFLLGLSPIFLSFMLFKITFQYFDQWLRFMMSYSIQVMISFAILTLWVFSMTLFTPFFEEMSKVVFPYVKVLRPAVAISDPVNTWGMCPLDVSATPIPHVACKNPSFNPIPPQTVAEANLPGGGGNADFKLLKPPSEVPKMREFLYYLLYNLITLIIVSYGFASLQGKTGEIAKQLAGPSYVPLLNKIGFGPGKIGEAAQRGAQDTKKMAAPEMFGRFNSRHDSTVNPYAGMVGKRK